MRDYDTDRLVALLGAVFVAGAIMGYWLATIMRAFT